MFEDLDDEGTGPTEPAAPPSSAPSVDELSEAVPGPELAARLMGVDLGSTSDLQVVEMVAAWQAVASWAVAMSAGAAAELDRRDAMHPAWPRSAGHVRERSVTGEEIATRLGCSRQAGRRLVRMGRAFEGSLWPTGEALAAGQIDPAKARVLVDGLDQVALPVAVLVQEEVLPTAPERTPTQLAADVQDALQRVDPLDADHRAAAAAAGRRVNRPRALPDGMAGMWAVLPAPAAAALSGELDALALSLRQAGDPRTLEQLRADVLCGAVLARPTSRARPTSSAPRDPARGPGLLGDPELVGDPGLGSGLRDAGSPEAGGARVDAREIADLLARTPVRAEIRVTVPLDVLLDLSDDPAHLEGHGALPASTARALARDGTWRRLVTDPLSGMVHDVGRRTYRPPADMADHVRTRDVTCVRPGCTTPARACEVDHTVPYGDVAEGGRTATDNLGCLCPRDHLLKTHGGFGLVQDAPGVFTWTTPGGQRHHRHAPPVGPRPTPGGTAAADQASGGTRPPQRDESPPSRTDTSSRGDPPF